MGQKLHIVEIKSPGYSFRNADWDRLHNYLQTFDKFIKNNHEVRKNFSGQWTIHLVCDFIKISDRDKRISFGYWKEKERIEQISWDDFLQKAITANEEFLNAQDRVRMEAAHLSDESN